MGRRNRQHIVKITWIEDNQLKSDSMICGNLFEALHEARQHQDVKCVQISDILGIETHTYNKHILNFIPEEISEEKMEEILETQPEELKQEIPVEIIEPSIEETIIEPVAEVVETPKKKTATKKPATPKKTATKKVS
jgi:hypothetical protein